MSTISKANRPRNAPGKTKNGKVKIVSLTLSQLQEMVEKVSRPRDKRKYQNYINVLIKKVNKDGRRSKKM